MSVNTVEIDKVLERLALSNEKRFNAFQVASLANESDPLEVNEYLLYKSEGKFGALTAKIETLCVNNHPDKHFELGTVLPNYEVECRICDSEYVPDLEFAHLVFYFREVYKQEIEKKNDEIQNESGKDVLVPPMDEFMTLARLLQSQQLCIVNGGIHFMNGEKFSFNNVNNPVNSAVSFGDESPNTVINVYKQDVENVTNDLLALIESEISDSKVKNELRELIEGAALESGSKEPKPAILRTLIDGTKGIMTTIVKSPALLDAYEKWVQFLQDPPTL
ncbi:hypothetical protein AB1K89_07045 [Sporosarcina sp. 179-K 8C2 HS]|uniref:hypothetical protein n=1 Tax=Sporosarcina sp. 179-K 8C2 HS TaxID=3142387 RepID=UPI00399FCE96